MRGRTSSSRAGRTIEWTRAARKQRVSENARKRGATTSPKASPTSPTRRKGKPKNYATSRRRGPIRARNPFNDLPLASGTSIFVRGDAEWLAVGTVKNSPRPVRACLSDLGRDARIFNDGEVVQLLRDAIEQEGTQIAFAKRHGINRTLLNEVVNGKRHASEPILKALGLHKVYAFDQNK
jgi:hypothetical protein